MKNLIKISFLIASIYWSVAVQAQSPQKFTYQAVVRTFENTLVSNELVGVRISIIQTSPSGIVVFQETHVPLTNENGLFSIEVGNGNLNSGDFVNINWSNGPYYIRTEVDPFGGSDYNISGTTQLLSVPYALHAVSAERLTNPVNEIDPVFNNSVAKGISSVDTAYWNNKLSTEVDGSVTNELQFITIANDTIFLSNGGFIKLPLGTGFDGQYSSLTGAPTSLSSFTNNVGYLTVEKDSSITNELQVLSISNDTIFLTDGGFAILPPGFDGQYSSLTGAPNNVSFFSNDVGYLSSEVDGSVTNELQFLSLSNDTVFLTNGGFVTLPPSFDGMYSSLIGAPTNISNFSNDVGYIKQDTTLNELEVDNYVANNGYLTSEIDGDVNNEIQVLSISNDTIFLSSGGFAKLPPAYAGTNTDSQQLGISNDTVFLTNGGSIKLPSSTGHYVGELFGGGIVFYVDQSGDHGLIASLDDLDTGGALWGLDNVDLSNSTSFTDGASNTANIINAGSIATDAANLCDAYNGGGFSDWYLPSYWELSAFGKTSHTISLILENDGLSSTSGLHVSGTIPTYWSSTDGTYAYNGVKYYSSYQLSWSGSVGLNTRQNNLLSHVRAVRSF